KPGNSAWGNGATVLGWKPGWPTRSPSLERPPSFGAAASSEAAQSRALAAPPTASASPASRPRRDTHAPLIAISVWFMSLTISLPSRSLLLRVEGGFDTAREVLGRPFRPEVQKHDARLLVGHVVVDRDDVDVRVTEGLEDILEFVLEHREVAVDDGRLLASSERRPGVHPHRLPDLGAVHGRLAAEGELRDAVLRLCGSSEDRLKGLRVNRARLRDTHAAETCSFWRRVCRIDSLPAPRRQLLGGSHTADVHEEDVRVIEEEVVVQRGHLESVVEGCAHCRIHLGLRQDDVAHDHRLVARRLERGPRREALERLHL